MTDTRTPTPASADAMEVWLSARTAWRTGDAVVRTDEGIQIGDSPAAARIIQQYGDKREAAGLRRGVWAAVKVALEAQDATGLDWTPNAIARRILGLLETQEAG